MESNKNGPSEGGSDLEVGDVVWAVDSWSPDSVELESATVMQASKVRIVLSETGLAFGCRTHFQRDDIGRRFHRSRDDALRAFATRERIKIEGSRRLIQRSEDLILLALAMIEKEASNG